MTTIHQRWGQIKRHKSQLVTARLTECWKFIRTFWRRNHRLTWKAHDVSHLIAGTMTAVTWQGSLTGYIGVRTGKSRDASGLQTLNNWGTNGGFEGGNIQGATIGTWLHVLLGTCAENGVWDCTVSFTVTFSAGTSTAWDKTEAGAWGAIFGLESFFFGRSTGGSRRVFLGRHT